jgi:hypothetical protein
MIRSNRKIDGLTVKNTTFLKVSSVLLTLASSVGITDNALAQSSISQCQPPPPNEYVLLVVTQTPETQEQLQRTLPTNANFTVCRYLDDTVTRISGFKQMEDASDWLRYVTEVVGLSAFVVRPAQTPVATAPSTNLQAFNPRPLGEGYAVLVDYFNQPDVAAQLQQLLGNDIGLVSYGRRPYLLATYTNNQQTANSALRRLSDRGFWSMVVDSRRVTLLRPMVNF